MPHFIKSCSCLASIISASILLVAVPAYGQSANYENLVFGELATGMGGAAIALADEPSAAFYNPAGLARLDYEVLGLSVQAYGASGLSVQDLLRTGDSSASLDSSTFGSFPTSVAYSFPLARIGNLHQAMALSVAAPVHQNYSYSQSLRAPGATLTSASSLRESELLGGLSYALRIGSLSFGATIFSEYASLAFENLVVAQDSGAGGGDLQSFSRARQSSGSQLGLTGVLGAHLQISPKWSAGLRTRLPNLALQSSSLHSFVEAEADGLAGTTDNIAVGGLKGTMRYPHPLGLGLGLGFRARRLRVAMDAKGYLPMSSYTVFEVPLQPAMPPSRTRDWDPRVRVPRSKLVINFALGAELFATEGISLLFGLNTDSSARPSDVSMDTGGASTMSFIGVTTGLRLHSRAGSFTFAMVARHGSGTVDAFVWDQGLQTGKSRIEQSSGMLTISWTRSLTENWLQLKSQLDGIVGQ